MARESLTEEALFKSRSEGNEKGFHPNFWVKSIPGRGNSKCKGPEVGAFLLCFRKIKEAGVIGVQHMRGRLAGDHTGTQHTPHTHKPHIHAHSHHTCTCTSSEK